VYILASDLSTTHDEETDRNVLNSCSNLHGIVSANSAFGAVPDNSNLAKLISQYNDNHMTVNDLAFFLTTHNFDATPKDGYVQVKIGSAIYRAVPNGSTGLADLSIIN